jgi:xanthine/CO dehydrogenase XdhC/CoxF family maturation factor
VHANRPIVADIVISTKFEKTESKAGRHLMVIDDRHTISGGKSENKTVAKANGVMKKMLRIGGWSGRI